MTLNPMTLQVTSWTAYLSATATVLTLLTGILFFTQEKLLTSTLP